MNPMDPKFFSEFHPILKLIKNTALVNFAGSMNISIENSGKTTKKEIINKIRTFIQEHKYDKILFINNLLKESENVAYDPNRDEPITQEEIINKINKVCEGNGIVIKNNTAKYINEPEILKKTASEKLNILITEVNQNIKEGRHISNIDRMYSLLAEFFQELCSNNDLHFTEGDFRKNVKIYLDKIVDEGHIKTEMGENIINCIRGIFHQYPNTRNNYSFSHESNVSSGRLLDEHESLLIFKVVSSIKEFIDSIEK